jgi:hypothetical protein
MAARLECTSDSDAFAKPGGSGSPFNLSPRISHAVERKGRQGRRKQRTGRRMHC